MGNRICIGFRFRDVVLLFNQHDATLDLSLQGTYAVGQERGDISRIAAQAPVRFEFLRNIEQAEQSDSMFLEPLLRVNGSVDVYEIR